MAVRCGRAVEDLSRRSETETVIVNRDGTETLRLHGSPTRFRRGAGWVDTDPTLVRKPDGSVASKAHPLDLRLSGARDAGGDLVTMKHEGKTVGFGWNGPLPEPVVEPTKTTWPDVLPGIDLVVSVTATGFEQFFVVKDRSAVERAKLLRLPLRTGGREVHDHGDGHLVLKDKASGSELNIPPLTMWDAVVGENSGDHLNVAPVAMRVVQGGEGPELELTPDPAFLDDPARVFPITIDPAIYKTYGTTFDTFVQSGYSSDQSGSTELKLGYSDDGGSWIARSYLRWPTADLAGTNVISAKLWMWEHHSWSCRAAQWQAEVTGWADTNTRYGSEPAWNWPHTRGTSTETKGWGSNCADGWVTMDVKKIFAEAAGSGWSETTMGLRGGNDSDHDTWKRFNSTNASSGRPYVEVTYNHYPAVPTEVAIDGQQQCATGEGLRSYLAATSAVITARLNDADSGQNLTGKLELKKDGVVVYAEKAADQIVAPGQVARWTLSGLTTGAVYTYRLRTDDSVDYKAPDNRGWTAACEFQAFPNPPATPQATVVEGDFTVHTVTSVKFAPAAGDIGVTGYEYGWDPSRFSMFVNARNDGTATVPITLQNEDGGILYVRARNWSGKVSTTWAELDVSFPNSGSPKPPVRGDFNGDGRGDVIVRQDLGGGRTGVYLLAGKSWEMHDPIVLADTTAYPVSATKMVTGDFNGDNLTDIVMMKAVTSTSATISVLASDGNGVADVQWWTSSGFGSWSVAGAKLLAGRVNADGLDDIIALSKVSSCSWRVMVFQSTGNTFANPVDRGGVSGCFDLDKVKPVPVDVDADGDHDIAFFADLSGCHTKLYLLRNNGGSFAAEVQQWDSGAGNFCWSGLQATSADYSADGRDDVFTTYDAGSCTLSTYKWTAAGNGSGYPTRTSHTYWTANVWCGGLMELQSSDYDGDSYMDYMWIYRCCGPHQVRVIVNHGWGGGFDGMDEWQGALGKPGVGWVTAGFDDAKYQLVNVNSGKCLSVPGAATTNGVQLVQESCNASALNQQFDPQMWRTPHGRIRPMHDTPGIYACLDISGSSLTDGGKVQQYNCNGTSAQNFWVEYVFGFSQPAVRIINVNSNKCFDVPGSSLVDGALIQQWTCNGTNAQNFYLRPVA